MKALVLSGGTGTRLRPLTYTMAKQLVPVANKPILHYVMRNLCDSGLRQVGVIISPETGGQVQQALAAENWDLTLTYIVQDRPLGLAHAVIVAREYLQEEPFVMYLGDNLIGQGLQEFVKAFEESYADALILLKRVSDPRPFGVVLLDDAGQVTQLVEKPEKPPSDYALVGVYIFSPAIHRAIEQIRPSWRGELEITDAIRKLLEEGRLVKSFLLQSWWLDCGKKDDLLDANRIVLDELVQREIGGEVEEDSRLYGRVRVDPGTLVRGSTIRGPVAIGENTIIEYSFIGPFTSIGSHCKITRSVIEHSVVLDGAQIIDVSRLEDSVIGRNAVVMKHGDNHGAYRLMVGDDSEVTF